MWEIRFYCGYLFTMIGFVKTRGFESEKLVRELAIPAKVENYGDEGANMTLTLESRYKGSPHQIAGKRLIALPRNGASRSRSSLDGGRIQKHDIQAKRVYFGQGMRKAFACGLTMVMVYYSSQQ